jgi:hypothetical protein
MLFDINLAGECDGFVMYHQPVASLRPIKPFSLRLPLATGSQMLVEPAHINCELCILDMCYSECPLTLYLLTCRIWWAANNASKGQMGFNLVFKELMFTAWQSLVSVLRRSSMVFVCQEALFKVAAACQWRMKHSGGRFEWFHVPTEGVWGLR